MPNTDLPTNLKLTKINLAERKALDFVSGDNLRVWNKLKDKDGKIRLQAFEGLVIARKHGTEMGATFTVRKITSGVGVEKIYPLYSSNIEKIEILQRAKTKKSKLYYVRKKTLRDIRKKLKKDFTTKSDRKTGITVTDLKTEIIESPKEN